MGYPPIPKLRQVQRHSRWWQMPDLAGDGEAIRSGDFWPRHTCQDAPRATELAIAAYPLSPIWGGLKGVLAGGDRCYAGVAEAQKSPCGGQGRASLGCQLLLCDVVEEDIIGGGERVDGRALQYGYIPIVASVQVGIQRGQLDPDVLRQVLEVENAASGDFEEVRHVREVGVDRFHQVP